MKKMHLLPLKLTVLANSSSNLQLYKAMVSLLVDSISPRKKQETEINLPCAVSIYNLTLLYYFDHALCFCMYIQCMCVCAVSCIVVYMLYYFNYTICIHHYNYIFF